jgi:glycerol-3-phosphate acyltransferase PlsY
MIELILACAFSYLLGSIPFGLVLTRMAGLGDIRAIGSGNIGATNVLRTGNKTLAALTLLFDGLKGFAAVFAVQSFAPSLEMLAALSALLGHLFPVWLKFKGGKGVATAIGVAFALCWPAAVTVCAMWAAVAKRFKISSLSALVAIGFLPLDVLVFGRADLALGMIAIAGLVFYKHKDNIRRLLNRTEPKIGEKHNAPTTNAQ